MKVPPILLLFILPFWVLAQRDTIPHIVTGQIDWTRFKQEMKAPVFQQNDMAIYILRKDSLGELISKEENAHWIQDFHFADVNNDRWLDAFYSGVTKAKGGYYTYFMQADTNLQFPVRMQAPGYVHQLTPSKNGLEFILRDDAHGKGYLHTITEYYLDFATHKLDTGWQLQMLSTTEVPIMRQAEAYELHYPTELRATPRIVDAPPVDHDQDGKPESIGNVVAQLDAHQPLFRLAENELNGHKWSFVVVLSTPTLHPVLRPLKSVRMAYAGWIASEALGE